MRGEERNGMENGKGWVGTRPRGDVWVTSPVPPPQPSTGSIAPGPWGYQSHLGSRLPLLYPSTQCT